MMKLRSTKFPRRRESTHFVSSSSNELELYKRYSPRHPNCHHLRSEQVEVEGMDMIEEQYHPMNHWVVGGGGCEYGGGGWYGYGG
jgi:hypothetical protein